MKYIITTKEKATIKNYLVLCFNSLSQFMCSNMCLSRVQLAYTVPFHNRLSFRNTINDFFDQFKCSF